WRDLQWPLALPRKFPLWRPLKKGVQSSRNSATPNREMAKVPLEPLEALGMVPCSRRRSVSMDRGGHKPDWSNSQWSKDWKGNTGSSYDNDEVKEMQKVISMMQRLVLRHEDSINLLKLDFSFVAHMRLNIPVSVVHMLYVAADGWRKLKAQEPQKLDRPMRTSLFVCFFAELKTRIQALDSRPADVDKMAELGWLVKGAPVTWQYLKWDAATQRHVIDTAKPPLPNTEILEHVDTLLANVVTTNRLARFHPTRPLADGMQGESIVFLIQVGNLGDACVSIRSSLKALCYNAVMLAVISPRRTNMPPQKRQRRAPTEAVQPYEGEGASGTLEDSMDLDCLLEEVECQWSPDVSGVATGAMEAPARTLGGIFMVGSCPLTSYEQDLRYACARQQVYLIRNVSLSGLCVPSECKAEALACGMVSSGQATWGQLQRLLSFLPEDNRIRWNQEPNVSNVSMQRPKRFTIGAWNFGNMAGVMRSSMQFPWTARALAGVISTFNEELRFSTCHALTLELGHLPSMLSAALM
ncbi:unnamed protein product, partial [Symbiodinium sp. KB8]